MGNVAYFKHILTKYVNNWTTQLIFRFNKFALTPSALGELELDLKIAYTAEFIEDQYAPRKNW